MRQSPQQFTVLDLFSGAGGVALGFEKAQFRRLGCVEIDHVAARTLVKNLGQQDLDRLGQRGDIRKLDPETFLLELERANLSVDVLAAGPPCQGFSRVGRGKLDALADRTGAFGRDRRNGLYRYAVAFLQVLRPKVFVLENVTGILHMRGRNIAEDICDAVRASGYTIAAAVLNSAWYGVPQIRERVFMIATRNDLHVAPSFPIITHEVDLVRGGTLCELPIATWRRDDYFAYEMRRAASLRPAVTVAEAFADLPPFVGHLEALRAGKVFRSHRSSETVPYAGDPPNEYCRQMRTWGAFHSAGVSDHHCRWTPRDFETFARMRPMDRYPQAVQIAEGRYQEAMRAWRRKGGRRPKRADFVPPYDVDNFPDKWKKLDGARPSWTVTAHLGKDTYSHIHFDSRQARAISVREAARLQSFPDGFVLEGNMGDAYRQIGNAVPPLMAFAVASHVREILTAAHTSMRTVA